MIDDLATALEVEAARAGSTTGEATSVLDAVPPPKRELSSRRRWSWAAILGLLLVVGAALLAVFSFPAATSGVAERTREGGQAVEITEATDYDPEGDGEEVGSKVELAATATRPAPPGKPSTTTPTPSPAPRRVPTPASAST